MSAEPRVALSSEAATALARRVLLYRHTCPRCRFLSRGVVLLSGNAIRRVPNDTPAAAVLYARHAEQEGKLALLHRSRLYTGRPVFAAAWWAILWCWLERIPLVGRSFREPPLPGDAE
jgi:hypothetical protein